MKNNIINNEQAYFFLQIKEKTRNSQYEAMKSVNKTLINLYLEIGKTIYINQQEQNWGRSIVEILSLELKKEFPNVKRLFK